MRILRYNMFNYVFNYYMFKRFLNHSASRVIKKRRFPRMCFIRKDLIITRAGALSRVKRSMCTLSTLQKPMPASIPYSARRNRTLRFHRNFAVAKKWDKVWINDQVLWNHRILRCTANKATRRLCTADSFHVVVQCVEITCSIGFFKSVAQQMDGLTWERY